MVLATISMRANESLSTGKEDGLSLSIVKTNILQVPTTLAAAKLLAVSGVEQPEVAMIGLAFPRGFNPAKPTPILFTSVTGDPYQSNIKELEIYRERALDRGWIVLTGQPHPWPDRKSDSVTSRRASAQAAFRTLATLCPGSESWPTAFAGFSGGSKMSQLLAGAFIAEGRHVVGALMSGCNENRWVQILDDYDPDRDALKNMGYFLSSGRLDQVSSAGQMKDVRTTLRKKGARHVRLETFDGTHVNHLPHIDTALEWFEQLMQSEN
jgi:predicted esterase